MSSDLIGLLIPAVAIIISILLMFGLPAPANVAVQFFNLRERELTIEMQSRQESHHPPPSFRESFPHRSSRRGWTLPRTVKPRGRVPRAAARRREASTSARRRRAAVCRRAIQRSNTGQRRTE